MIVAAVLAALVASVTPGFVSSASAAAAPTDFAGVGDWAWPTNDQAKQLGIDGTKTVRAGLAWDWVEHTQGKRAWGGVDTLVQNASANSYELVLAINGCTTWACGALRTAPTTDTARAEFQSFVGDAVRRYGAGGSYWTSHPSAKPAKIDWQIWNEVNVGADWPNPTTAGYQQMLSETNATIKGIDPSARVISAGLAELPATASGATLTSFLTGLEKAPAFRTSADVVAIHGYAEDPAGVVRILDTTRRIMQAAGDTRPIWMTELGWGSAGPAHPFAVDPDTQAAYLRKSFDTMVACRDRWGLSRAIWFSLQDIDAARIGEPDYWGMHTGLYGTDGSAKASLAAFREFEGGREIPDNRASSCTLPGGADPNATSNPATSSDPGAAPVGPAPTITIVRAPTLVGQTTTASQVDFVTSMGNSGHAECSLNGAAWSVCSTPYPIAKTAEGKFTLQVRAVNAQGTASATPATASWTVDLTAPKTVFKKTPKRIVRATVAARFGTRATRLDASGSEVVTFQCSLNNAAWKACGAKYRAKAKKLGKQTLRVRAVDAAGNIDAKGATAKFTVAKLAHAAKKA
jgi:hypothetical protein